MFEIYKDKKVLITGHTGFKGSWLTLWLLQLGANVVGYALDPQTPKDNFVLAGLETHIKDYRADIRNKEKLFEVVRIEKPEIIFHLAAQPLVLESYNNPLYTIETNTLGTSNILEAFRVVEGPKVLIIITTDKVYKNMEWDWGYRENDQLGGKDIYSSSKAASEILIESYRNSFFEKTGKLLASVRAGNVIGGGDWSKNRIIPDCIKAIESNNYITIRNPYAVRPWQHVLEPLSGYLVLGEKLLNKEKKFADVWNFGPVERNFITVDLLVKEVIKSYGKGKIKKNKRNNDNKETTFLSLDISKAIKKLKWKPVLTFKETIDFTIQWYKNYSSVDVWEYDNNQIKEYMKLWKLRNEN